MERKRINTVIKWFKEYGLEVVSTDHSSFNWGETKIKNKNGNILTFEITNNHIWYIRHDRVSFGKTKTELYLNLDKMKNLKAS